MIHLKFQLSYHTEWGEKLCLYYRMSTGQTGAIDMRTQDGETWQGEIRMEVSLESITYAYRVCNAGDVVLRAEEGEGRFLSLKGRSEVCVFDHWTDDPLSAVFRRSAFASCVFKAACSEEPGCGCFLRLHALPPSEGLSYAVAGSADDLGAWDAGSARKMLRVGPYDWVLPVDAADFRNRAEYKYVLLSESDNNIYAWEEGPNRLLPHVAELGTDATLLVCDRGLRMAPRRWRGAGIVVPVFSLRSNGSFGVGDFGDLYDLVDGVADMGMNAIQVLPINDTSATGTWGDSYPYNCLSVFALHPAYLDPREWRESAAFQACEEIALQLNAFEELDYVTVMANKLDFLHRLFDEIGMQTLNLPEYQDFVRENKQWLWPYTLFCHFRDRYHTADFRQWGEHAVYDEARLQRYLQESGQVRRETSFYAFVQYLLHRQMARVSAHARERGIILKGDLPIGISSDSVPAWVDGRLFHFDGQAGAPPDDFAVNGQNWGFPTYNWEEMAKDNYRWWRRRIKHQARFFDAFRIDHVLGFFRIWEVPSEHIYGVLGRFRPALPLSKAEISAFGFKSSVEEAASPRFSEEEMVKLAEKYKCDGLRDFFVRENEVYTLRKDVDTQRKIMAVVEDKRTRLALMDCVADVLFIRDPEKAFSFHPRITPWETFAYKRLGEAERQAYNQIYEQFFYHRHNDFWREKALEKLPAVTDCSEMLPCAEDLGMVPESVKGTLEELNILSLEIQRMPKHFGVRFDNLAENPYLSVSTIATHDMPPLRLWWRQRESATAYWQQVLNREGLPPEELDPETCEKIVAMHLDCPSMLCLLSLQDWLAVDARLRNPRPEKEQINDPANPHQHWCYRMHLTMEEMLGDEAFRAKVRGLIAHSGRTW